MNFKLEFLDRGTKTDEFLPLFRLLYKNMKPITPLLPYEDELREWLSAVMPAMQDERRYIILAYSGGEIVGFLQYSTDGDILYIEELQIDKAARKTTLILRLVSFMLSNIPDSIQTVSAYAHRKNRVSIDLILSLGLAEARQLYDIEAIQFKGDAAPLLERFSKYGNLTQGVHIARRG